MSAPLTLETLHQYYSQANGVQNKSQIVAFHLKNYILSTAVETLKTQRTQGKDVTELTKEVQSWFQDLETLKTALGQQANNKDMAQKQYTDFSLYLYKKAMDQYQNKNYTQQLADELSTVSLLYDAYSIFNSPNQEVENNKKQAKSAHQSVVQALAGGSKNQFSNIQNSTFAGFQAAESVFVSKNSIDQKKSQQTNPQQQSNQPGGGAFTGFSMAESSFVPQNSLNQGHQQGQQGQQQNPHQSMNPYNNFPIQPNQFPPYDQQGYQNFNPYHGGQNMSYNNPNPNLPGGGQFGAQPTDQGFQNQNQMSQSKNIAKSGVIQGQGNNQQQQGQGQGGLPDFSKFGGEGTNPYQSTHYPNPGQPFNPYQSQSQGQGQGQGHQNFGMSQQNQGNNQQQQGGGLPDFSKFGGGEGTGNQPNPYQSTHHPNPNPGNMSQNPHQNQGFGGNPYASGNGNIGNPYGGNPYANNNTPYGGPGGNQGFPEQGNAGNVNNNIGHSSQNKNRMEEEPPKKEEPKPLPQANPTSSKDRVVPTRGGFEGKGINLPSDKQAQLRELCMMAVSELDYKNVEEAKANIRKCLSIVKDLM